MRAITRLRKARGRKRPLETIVAQDAGAPQGRIKRTLECFKWAVGTGRRARATRCASELLGSFNSIRGLHAPLGAGGRPRRRRQSARGRKRECEQAEPSGTEVKPKKRCAISERGPRVVSERRKWRLSASLGPLERFPGNTPRVNRARVGATRRPEIDSAADGGPSRQALRWRIPHSRTGSAHLRRI